MSLQQQIESILGVTPEFDYWESALALGALMNRDSSKKENCIDLIAKVREYQGEIAMSSTSKTTMVMGTSGWRDKIGSGFSAMNVRRAIHGIITTLKSESFLKWNGSANFEEIQQRGILLFRDNRFLGDEFKAIAANELTAQGVKVYDAGECPTGVGSALLTSLSAAGSINFTPSHNPMDYQGLKFNPADGGPAPQEITSLIETHTNGLMEQNIEASNGNRDLITNVDPIKIYIEFLLSKNIFDLDYIRNWVATHRHDIKIVVDYMHGSGRGFVEEIFGKDLTKQLRQSASLLFLNTEDDFSFHGLKPEPSAVNQKPLMDILKSSKRKYTLAVAMDPDADRIRFSDAEMDIDMNSFGPIAYQIQLDQKDRAGIVSTAPSSDFALEMAKQNKQDFYETAVGFKYFRPFLLKDQVAMAFEESDGISFGGHTLEKDALVGFLAALDSMARSSSNLSQQFNELRKCYGYFYPQKAGVDVKGVSVEEWQEYKGKVVEILKHKLFSKGDAVTIGDKKIVIDRIQTVDGLKLNFKDRSWILLRPSGTEPKFRIYYEVVSEQELPDIQQKMSDYLNCGTEILELARQRV